MTWAFLSAPPLRGSLGVGFACECARDAPLHVHRPAGAGWPPVLTGMDIVRPPRDQCRVRFLLSLAGMSKYTSTVVANPGCRFADPGWELCSWPLTCQVFPPGPDRVKSVVEYCCTLPRDVAQVDLDAQPVVAESAACRASCCRASESGVPGAGAACPGSFADAVPPSRPCRCSSTASCRRTATGRPASLGWLARSAAAWPCMDPMTSRPSATASNASGTGTQRRPRSRPPGTGLPFFLSRLPPDRSPEGGLPLPNRAKRELLTAGALIRTARISQSFHGGSR